MSKIDTTNVVAWQSVHYGIPIDETHDPAEAQKWLDSGVTVRALYTSPQPSKPWVGDWIWAWLMDWCKRNGASPASYDSLFKMVTEARAIESALGIKGDA